METIQSEIKDFSTKMVGKVSLAPMVRMNTLPFRLLTLQYGADYVFSEEIIDRKFLTCVRVENPLLQTIDYVTARDYSLVLRLKKEEKEKFILQIGTNSAETAVQAVEKLLPDIGGVDVNMGCPKKFSVQGGMGAALMRNPDNAETIMRALVEKFGSKISVSCKIRVLKTFEDTLKYVLAMQATGIHWISIHPRTAAEESRVPARWFLTKTLLETGLIKIPVLGSGDLFSPLDVHKYLGFTKASGVILARGAIHNPEIFKLKEKILKTDIPMVETSEGVEAAEDWKDNCVEPEITDTSVALQEKEDEQIDSKKKGKASEYDEESIEFSQNLVKVYERRYARLPMERDIIHQVRDYFKLCIQSGNHYQNTKYCIMYMLKTHKHHFDTFKKIHGSKTLLDYANALGLSSEELFDQGLDPAYFLHFEGTYYRKNKHIVDAQAEQEGLAVAQQPGFKPDNKGNPHGKGVGIAVDEDTKQVGQKRGCEQEDCQADSENKRVKND